MSFFVPAAFESWTYLILSESKEYDSTKTLLQANVS